MMANITFLSFLLFSMCNSIQVAVNAWLNCSFFYIYADKDYYKRTAANAMPSVGSYATRQLYSLSLYCYAQNTDLQTSEVHV